MKIRLFYGWIVCAMGFLLTFVTMGMVSNGLSIFLPYMLTEYDLTNSQGSSFLTLRCGFALAAMFFIGHYYRLVGYRLGTFIAAVLCGAAFLLFLFADGYPMLCLASMLLGLSYGLGSMIPVSIIMNRWFIKRRGLAIGICSAGSSFAIIIFPSIFTAIIESTSLDATFLFASCFAFVISIIIFTFMRAKPSDCNLKPYGQEEALDAQRQAENPEENRKLNSFTLTRRQWILLGGISIFMGALANPGFVHLPVLFTSENFKPMTVALIVTVTGIVTTVFKVVYGRAADRLGGYMSSMLFCTILLMGYVLCCLSFTENVPLGIAAAVVLGIGYPIATVGIPVWAGDFASPDNYPEVMRKLQMIYAAGAMLFANMPGIMADLTGSYITAYAIFALMMEFGLLLLNLAYKSKAASSYGKLPW